MQPQAKKTPAVQPQAKKTQHCNHKRNKETSAGFKSKGWSIRPLTGCRNSIFKTVKSKPKPWQTLAGFKPKPSPVKLSNVAFWRPKETERWCNHKQRKPQQCNHKQRNPSIATTSETRKPQQDSSPRGSQFVPWRAAETASSKPLKANQNHGKPWQDLSPKRKPIQLLKWFCGATTNKETPAHACETWQGGAPAGFKRKGWSLRPQTGCRNSIWETVKSKAKPWQTLAGFKPQAEVKGLCGACMRNRETPAGLKPKPAKTIPRKTL